ncbi:MAG TPA: hypothetical protein VHE60_14670 [Pyrinomonadaceae bacterium]|nr:hypothetical protein [Pyrinomonadaceae bacterium]
MEQALEEIKKRQKAAFEELFADGQPEKVVALAEGILGPSGGLLFDGHRLDAPADYRKPID